MRKINLLCVISLISLAPLTLATEFDVGQLNKKFSIKRLSVKVGDTVNFTNQDPFFHNIYSLSEPFFFDLGSYPKGQSKSVSFDQPGVVDVECAIHPKMHMKITVE